MKTITALLVLAATSSLASAQSSVILFGIVDTNVGVVRNGAAGSVANVGSSGIDGSRLGFRGTEDLGGGLKAGFWLEGQLFTDTGNPSGFNFLRRSTISLLSDSLGELRVGRDYTPNYWARDDFDPFNENGVGAQVNMMVLTQPIQPADALPAAAVSPLGSGVLTFPRASNSIQYFLPDRLGGVYGSLMVALGEKTAGGQLRAGRIGYKNDALNVSAEYDRTSLPIGNLQQVNLGASYDFGVVKLMGLYGRIKRDMGAPGTAEQKNVLLGLTAPVGPGLVRLSYNRARISGAPTGVVGLGLGTAHMVAAGYVYDLSKRTALYATYARIRNSAATQFVVGANGPALGGLTGQTSSGYELGIRHRF
jgi:predicted porin